MGDGFAHGLVGLTLDGRYRLDAVLGEGGMGSVFRATQLAMDRKVAVKLLKPHLTTDHVALQRFANEARATLKVDSPHAVKVLDFGVTPLGDWYMVLEYLDGRTVQKELEVDGAFAPARVAHIARQTLEALAAAHHHGLVHRDVKPDNLLLMRVGADADYTKVLDFGVAKLMQGASGENLALTAAGMVFGTPEFMSPEQACGYALDGRSDLYSLAATMFVMLTGTPLFEGKSAIEWLTHHARTPAPHLAIAAPQLGAYPELDALLQRCLAKHREKRPSSAEEMAALIDQLAPSLQRPPGPATEIAGVETPPRPVKPTLFGSSYFHALPQSEVSAGQTIVPPQARGSTSQMLRHVKKRSRTGLYLMFVGVVVASMIGVAIGFAIRRSNHGSVTPPPRDAQVVDGAGPINVPADAAVDAAAIDAPIDAAAPQPHPVPHHSKADEYVREAEDGLRAGNVLKQMSNAQAALDADPHNVRARLLLADALFKSGQLEEGCAALRPLGRNAIALQRRKDAGCPP